MINNVFKACAFGITALLVTSPNFSVSPNQETGGIQQVYRVQSNELDSEIVKYDNQENDTIQNQIIVEKKLSDMICFLKSLLIEKDIETFGTDYLADVLNNLKNVDESFYHKLLDKVALSGNYKLIEATLLHMGNIEFKYITIREEVFVVDCLKTDNLNLQYFALSTLLDWGDTSLYNEIKEVFIDNKYLQSDLVDFLTSIEERNAFTKKNFN